VLGLVAAWRVSLMTRALAVLLDDRGGPAFYVVMLVASVAVLVGALLTIDNRGTAPTTPMLISHMGGIEPSGIGVRQRQRMTEVTCLIAVLGVLTVPLWLWALESASASASHWRQLLSAPSSAAPTSSAWLLAAGGLVVFLGW